ncbi:SUZ RNA-binding domain-containing isoform X2 [Rhynchophorus ferrugineus]|uniref:SUZ RNA-binding domain-containing isoform X2 n=1 Tax=Rhynchophorus ferrugineus TaxID=354439 RepID=UPI003FCC60D6
MAAKHQEDTIEVDSWEDLEETDILEKKFNKLIMPSLEDSRVNGNVEKVPIKLTLTGDDALRTQYVPPEPTVKILKRPTKGSQISTDIKKMLPKKTLQQREQEYAEARLRILGEASSERPEERISIIKGKSDIDNVIRTPRGPDGTKGFNFRR